MESSNCATFQDHLTLGRASTPTYLWLASAVPPPDFLNNMVNKHPLLSVHPKTSNGDSAIKEGAVIYTLATAIYCCQISVRSSRGRIAIALRNAIFRPVDFTN